MIMVTSARQSQSWYPVLLKMTVKNPILLPDHPKSFTQSSRQNLSSNSELVTKTGGMASKGQNLSSKGIPERAINLISNA